MVRHPGTTMTVRGRAATNGLVAGFVGSLTMVLLLVLLRLFLGIPLLVELASDRIIPMLSISQFGRLAAKLGGLTRGKEVALISGFALQVALATIAGMLGAVILSGRPERGRVWGRALASVLALAAIGTVGLLWPVLASNYRGLPPGPATVTNVVAILAAYALYGLAFWMALRALTGGSRGVTEAHSAASAGRVLGRRTLLMGGAGLGLALVSGGLVDLLYRLATVGPNGYDGLSVRGPHTDPITPNDRFYIVTKNLIDPMIDRGLWRLQVGGLVSHPHTYGFDDLASFPSISQTQTLECISNGVGQGLMSNAAWKGVPLATLLTSARPRPEGRFVLMHAADGYVHIVSLQRAMKPSTLVAYQMNGQPLPHRHGYPARVLVPGTYGEVNVKWVDRIEVLSRPIQGYYERQGWRPWFVNTTSRFDRPGNGQSLSLSAGRLIPMNGVAYAGDRGISKVEVSADGGSNWQDATIDYAPSRLAWALWSGTLSPPGPGTYTLTVRATDGTGAVQTSARRGRAPSGATGLHQVRVVVRP
jgi:DMSO/TMAO reductase YedYZ molybdopterin-dependent catalytic subunit